MKKILLSLTLALFALITINAQSNKEEIEYYQSIFGMEKKAIVSDFIKLEGEAKSAFWSLYDEYETERKALGMKRIEVLDKYAQKYSDLDEVTTEEILKESIDIRNQSNKLIQKYTNKIKKSSGIKAAAQFYQLENYFRNVIYLNIMDGIPFIDELVD